MNTGFEFTADEVIKDGRCKRKDIEEIKTWIKSIDLPNVTDEKIVLFLLACDGNIEYTKETIKTYYYYVYHAQNLTTNRSIYSKDMMLQTTVVDSVVIPKRTKDNYLVIFQRLIDYSYRSFNLESNVKFMFALLDFALMEKPPPQGLVIILDMKGLGIMHLTRLRIGLLRILINYLQEALPCQIKAIHVFNTVYFIDKVLSIIRPLMRMDLFEKINFHNANIDMEAFFENDIEADCIPSDYGGNLPTVKILAEATLEKMKKKSEWFVLEDNMRRNYKPPSKS